jgi:hypothetical protein
MICSEIIKRLLIIRSRHNYKNCNNRKYLYCIAESAVAKVSRELVEHLHDAGYGVIHMCAKGGWYVFQSKDEAESVAHLLLDLNRSIDKTQASLEKLFEKIK